MSRRLGVGRRPKTTPGMYIGWGASGDLDTWQTTNAMGIPIAHEFGDRTQWTWFETGTNFDTWNTWVGAKTGRRFSYSCPLLTDTDDSGLTIPQKYVQLAAGTYDSHFTTLGNAFQAQPNLRNSFVRLGWEFNGESWPWSIPPGDATTLANYKTGFNRAAAALKAACPTLKIEWCPNCQLDYTNQTFAAMYPGNTYIDVIGIGAYDYYWPGGTPTHAQVWSFLRDGETGVNGLKDQVALARANNKMLAHTEWGLWSVGGGPGTTTGEGDSAAFVTDLAAWHDTYGYAYQIYNNQSQGPNLALDSCPNALAEYVRRYRTVAP